MKLLPLLARAADFQAAWYFTLLLSVMLLAVFVGAGYAIAGIRRMWAGGEHGPAAVLAGATGVTLLILIGMYATAIGGLFAIHAGSG